MDGDEEHACWYTCTHPAACASSTSLACERALDIIFCSIRITIVVLPSFNQQLTGMYEAGTQYIYHVDQPRIQGAAAPLEMPPMHGFLNLYKPAGLVSRVVTNKVQFLVHKNVSVGHVGTLDPFAEGVLAIAIGKATKLIPYLGNDKQYEAVIKFGLSTDSGDLAGTVRSIKPVEDLDFNVVERVLMRFVGDIQQVPPAASAVKISGERAYALARQVGSEAVDGLLRSLPSRKVRIDRIAPEHWCRADTCGFPELRATIDCQTGTYIRSIAVDIGAALADARKDQQPVAAVLAWLRRTRSNGFHITQSVPISQLQKRTDINDCLLPCDSGILSYPAVVIGHSRLALQGLPREAFASESRPSLQGLLQDHPAFLRSLSMRWAVKSVPCWAVTTPTLCDPMHTLDQAVQGIHTTLQGLPGAPQQPEGEGSSSTQRKDDSRATPSPVPSQVDRQHIVRVYTLTTLAALKACKLPFGPIRTALPEASLLDLLGGSAEDAPSSLEGGGESSPVLAFLGLGRVTAVHQPWTTLPPPHALEHRPGGAEGEGSSKSSSSSSTSSLPPASPGVHLVSVQPVVSMLELTQQAAEVLHGKNLPASEEEAKARIAAAQRARQKESTQKAAVAGQGARPRDR